MTEAAEKPKSMTRQVRDVIDYWIPKLGTLDPVILLDAEKFTWYEALPPEWTGRIRAYIRWQAREYGHLFEPRIEALK